MASNAERAYYSRLRHRTHRTPEQQAELDAYEARRARPGRRPAVVDAEPVLEGSAPPPPPPPASPPSSAPPPPDPPRGAAGGAPPIEVVDMTGEGDAGANGAGSSAGPAPGVLPEPSPIAAFLGAAIVSVIRSQDELVGEAFGVSLSKIPAIAVGKDGKTIKLDEVIWPGLAAAWAFSLDKWGLGALVGEDLTDEQVLQMAAIGSGLYGIAGGWIARKKFERAVAAAAAAPKPAASSSSSAPPPAEKKAAPTEKPPAPAPSTKLALIDDDKAFRPRATGSAEEK